MSTPTGKETRSLSSTPSREVIKIDVDDDPSESNTPTLPPKKEERELGEIEETLVIKVHIFPLYTGDKGAYFPTVHR